MSRTALFASCPGTLTRLGILTGSLLIGLAQTATAQNACLQTAYGKNVQCTANDVRVAFADNVRDPLTGQTITSCIAGSTFSFVADFHVVTTATARENIGLYFATGGQGSARTTGTCSDNIISPTHKNPNVDYVANPNAPLLGTSQYEELDTSTPTDTCGDISTSDNNQVVAVYVQNALCKAAAGTNQVALPNCTSWQQPGGTLLCVSPAPQYPWVPAAVPGSPSKCNCDDTFTIPVTIQSPNISVAKACNTANTNSPNPPDFTDLSAPNPHSCTLTEGGQVTYTVDMVNNQSNFGSVVIDQICDSAYGTIFQVAGFPASLACPAGSVTGATVTPGSGCAADTIAYGGSATCTFTVNQAEGTTVDNIATVRGHGTSAGSFGPTKSNQVEVVSSEASSSATISKTYGSTTNACATVRYNVQVSNSSGSGSDETETLSALSDSAFGDITKLSTSVLGTTCGVAVGQAGLGTLSGVTASASNGGALSTTIGVGSSYSCQFDAQFCSALDPNGCISHSNTVTPTLTGDEGETVTQSGGGLNVRECLTPSTF